MMKKEILTREIIKREYISDVKREALITAWPAYISFICCIALFWSMRKQFSSLTLSSICRIFAFLMLSAIFFWTFIESINNISKLKKNDFIVVTDKLINTEEHEPSIIPIFSKPYRLYFQTYGEYCLSKKHYRWSELYSMNDIGVYNYSSVGDEFYLVIIDNKRPVAIYNKKLFEFISE